MAIGDICILRESAGGTQMESTTPINFTWDTQVRCDTANFATAAGNAYQIALETTGHYLSMFNVAAEDDTGSNRRAPHQRYILDGTTMEYYGRTGGYIRDSGSALSCNNFGAAKQS